MTLDMAIRKTGIGSSEVGAILGLNPYQSAFDCWLEKTGQVEPFAGNEHTRLGKRMEPVIMDLYDETAGVTTERYFDKTFRNPERAWQLASPDGMLGSKVVEAKNVGSRMAHQWGEPGTDAAPESHIVQTVWQMSTLGKESADIAALIGGSDFRIYPVPMDKDLEDMLLTKVEKFWRVNVVGGVPPEMRSTDRTMEWVKAKYRRNVAPLRVATAEESRIASDYQGFKSMMESLEKKEADAKLQLQASIGNAEGIAGDGFQITWKATKDSVKTDWEKRCRDAELVLSMITDKSPAEQTLMAIESHFDLIAEYDVTKPGVRRLLAKFDAS